MNNITVAFLAQSVERAALNRAVVGSRPTGGVLFFWEKRRTSSLVYKSKKCIKEKAKKTLPHGIEPWTYRLTADRSAD